jgi:hypothetical protein
LSSRPPPPPKKKHTGNERIKITRDNIKELTYEWTPAKLQLGSVALNDSANVADVCSRGRAASYVLVSVFTDVRTVGCFLYDIPYIAYHNC